MPGESTSALERLDQLEAKMKVRMERLRGPAKGYFDVLKSDGCAVCGGSGPFAIEQWYEVPRDRVKWQLCESCTHQVDVEKVKDDFKFRVKNLMTGYRMERRAKIADLKSSESKTRNAE